MLPFWGSGTPGAEEGTFLMAWQVAGGRGCSHRGQESSTLAGSFGSKPPAGCITSGMEVMGEGRGGGEETLLPASNEWDGDREQGIF